MSKKQKSPGYRTGALLIDIYYYSDTIRETMMQSVLHSKEKSENLFSEIAVLVIKKDNKKRPTSPLMAGM